MNEPDRLQTADSRYVIHPDGKGGFNVSYGPASEWSGCNAMPGATGGFDSVESAQLAIRCLDHVGGEQNAQRWWDLWYRVSGVTQRSRDERKDLAKRLGYDVKRVARHEYVLVQRDPNAIPADKSPSDLAFRAMVSAHSMCPSELSHLDRMRWMAARVEQALAAPGGEPQTSYARPARERQAG
jgi:hypothetical protein